MTNLKGGWNIAREIDEIRKGLNDAMKAWSEREMAEKRKIAESKKDDIKEV